jgi:hypothetical protein
LRRQTDAGIQACTPMRQLKGFPCGTERLSQNGIKAVERHSGMFLAGIQVRESLSDLAEILSLQASGREPAWVTMCVTSWSPDYFKVHLNSPKLTGIGMYLAGMQPRCELSGFRLTACRNDDDVMNPGSLHRRFAPPSFPRSAWERTGWTLRVHWRRARRHGLPRRAWEPVRGPDGGTNLWRNDLESFSSKLEPQLKEGPGHAGPLCDGFPVARRA